MKKSVHPAPTTSENDETVAIWPNTPTSACGRNREIKCIGIGIRPLDKDRSCLLTAIKTNGETAAGIHIEIPADAAGRVADLLLGNAQPVQTWIVRSIGNNSGQEEFSVVKHDPEAVMEFALNMCTYPEDTQGMVKLVNHWIFSDATTFRFIFESRTYFFTKAQADWFYGCKPR